ncbi:MAG TPA: hypothetical protein VMF62_04280 [Acetobacteraceae bacterium]|jgi:hypothetical protein|nr:hypothetical protein [Acetobacteraceae bacterium]
MTELLNPDRLREIAASTAQPSLPPASLPSRRPLITLQWTIDWATGRPFGTWVVSDAPDTAS